MRCKKEKTIEFLMVSPKLCWVDKNYCAAHPGTNGRHSQSTRLSGAGAHDNLLQATAGDPPAMMGPTHNVPRPDEHIGASTSAADHPLHGSSGERADGDNNEDNDDADDVMSAPAKPALSMRFESTAAAKKHYQDYARWNGFGMRTDYQRPIKSGETSRAQFVCYLAGRNKKEKDDPQRPESIVPKRKRNITERTGCQARMKVKLDGATYIVDQFEEEHNHSVLKKFDLGKYLRSHRHMPREEREFVKLLHACNLRTSQMMQILSTLHGKLNDLSYTRTDMANFRATLRREHCVMDMKYTLRYFKKLKKDDDDFYNFELDDEDRVINLYCWVDAEARRSYKYYNDCISFDTTYLTNKYNMPCAPFIGINNHGSLFNSGEGS
ncbi:protein FAR1-RELATED SEQUENCE 5-like [Brachypodium distachyon]|uniref:protein FAR1-RELATED SEQUENCE 5-like n=1 Tax=Brachypodium distachyon TaxID=15368 RepID=UPI000D0D5D81|nr:protein FAR1-RELATED SEQUENCE 5-like [Brachypodium distachyon]|eukprot:XP_024310919.1 protein FAR1-RELATED SEQUENCE 5-like [Brachypodium distachyon]